jgi:hypothetical protein
MGGCISSPWSVGDKIRERRKVRVQILLLNNQRVPRVEVWQVVDGADRMDDIVQEIDDLL